MFKAISILTLMFTMKVFASPSVGDSASYKGFLTVLDTRIDFVKEIKLTEYDPAKNSFMQIERTTSLISGETEVVENWIHNDDLASEESTTELIKNCPAIGGVILSVNVVAGSFKSCQLVDEENVISFGLVPFAIIKAQSPGFSMELTSFSRGNN